MTYSVGDAIVYPNHGAGTITRIAPVEVRGRARDYLTIEISHSRMTAMVPVENADRVGLRRAVDGDLMGDVVQVLRAKPTPMPKDWHHRRKYNAEKLKTGDILEVAEVVRNLADSQARRELPLGERQQFAAAKGLLASEVKYARGLDEDEASTWLEAVLSRRG